MSGQKIIEGLKEAIEYTRNGRRLDPEYDHIPPVVESTAKRGVQCGECGMKFDYGVSYGYACGNARCPRR